MSPFGYRINDYKIVWGDLGIPFLALVIFRSSHPGVFLGKDVLKICSNFTGEHPCQSAIWISCFAALLKSHFGMGVHV